LASWNAGKRGVTSRNLPVVGVIITVSLSEILIPCEELLY
jgi:hypothetical protein